MKKHYTLLASALTFSGAIAQFSSGDICPQAGESYTQHYCQFQYPNGGGVGTTEDYSGLITDSTATVSFVAASSAPNGASFPTATVAQVDAGGNYVFYSITSGAYEDLGWDLAGAGVTVASDPETWMSFPAGYGTTWTDNHAISFTTTGITTTRSGSVFGQGDATSTTLIMPYGQVTDVTRFFLYDTYTDNVGGFMTIDYTFTYHFYYKAGFHHPLLIVQDLLIEPSVGASTHTLFSVYSDPVGNGMAERPASFLLAELHPQPATDAVDLSFQLVDAASVDLEVLDATGRSWKVETWGHMPAGRHERRLDLDALARGTYLVRLRADEAVLTRPLIIQ